MRTLIIIIIEFFSFFCFCYANDSLENVNNLFVLPIVYNGLNVTNNEHYNEDPSSFSKKSDILTKQFIQILRNNKYPSIFDSLYSGLDSLIRPAQYSNEYYKYRQEKLSGNRYDKIKSTSKNDVTVEFGVKYTVGDLELPAPLEDSYVKELYKSKMDAYLILSLKYVVKNKERTLADFPNNKDSYISKMQYHVIIRRTKDNSILYKLTYADSMDASINDVYQKLCGNCLRNINRDFPVFYKDSLMNKRIIEDAIVLKDGVTGKGKILSIDDKEILFLRNKSKTPVKITKTDINYFIQDGRKIQISDTNNIKK